MEDTDQSDSRNSALRENLGKKGRNSYYYAHAKINNGPIWDGQEVPRLLNSESIGGEEAESKFVAAVPITNYAWSDDVGGKVKLYVDLENIGDHPKDQIDFVWDANSFSLTILDLNGENRKLAFKRLFASIENAKIKQKANKILVILTKLEENDWPCLNSGTDQQGK